MWEKRRNNEIKNKNSNRISGETQSKKKQKKLNDKIYIIVILYTK